MPRVNYLIACSSHRADKIDSTGMLGRDVLRNHLTALAKTDTSALSQVTIIRAIPLDRNSESDHYWNVKDIKLSCPVVTIDVKDFYFSYSSWIQAVQKYGHRFDYYIMIEDDYYPSLTNFVSELIRIHSEKLPEGGYLNSFTTDHAAVSNGIADQATFVRGVRKNRDAIKLLAQGAQRYFGQICFDSKIVDYTDQYRTLFWCHHGMVEQTHDPDLHLKEDIFRPIQYINLGETLGPVSISPLSPPIS